MHAMLLDVPGQPLRLANVPKPTPNSHQLLLRVQACGICRTDLHIVDGELTEPKLPLIMGHQIVGTVVEAGDDTTLFKPGQRVGVPWLGHTCQHCRYCLNNQKISVTIPHSRAIRSTAAMLNTRCRRALLLYYSRRFL